MLDLLPHLVDGRIQLRIAAADHLGRVVDHLDVGLDAHSLDDPVALPVVRRSLGDQDGTAVDEWGGEPGPGEAAGRARADQLAEAGVAEELGQRVASRDADAVDEQALGLESDVIHHAPVDALPTEEVEVERSTEEIDEAVRPSPAQVPARVDDQRFSILLPIELTRRILDGIVIRSC
jgi:hypothetical protein